MTKLDQAMVWAGVVACGALAVLCVIGAHLGTRPAADLFRSAPMAVAWGLLTAGLLVGCVRALLAGAIRHAGLAGAYGGAALVLAGAMAGSPTAHRLAARYLGSSKVSGGVMCVAAGLPSNTLGDEQTGEPIATLPFVVRLEQLEVIHHEPDVAAASQPVGPAEEIVSHLAIMRDGQVLTRAAVSANHPMHYGGYQFTQSGYIPGERPAVVLTVVSQWGRVVICGGLSLLVVSVVCHLWVRPAAGYLRRRVARGRQD